MRVWDSRIVEDMGITNRSSGATRAGSNIHATAAGAGALDGVDGLVLADAHNGSGVATPAINSVIDIQLDIVARARAVVSSDSKARQSGGGGGGDVEKMHVVRIWGSVPQNISLGLG